MTESPSEMPSARLKRSLRFSPIWLTPLVAVGVAIYLLLTAAAHRGPVIAIAFENAEGLAAGQTQIKHRSVALGTVDDIRLSKDLSHVVVHARMDARALNILTDHARFWVVRPQLSPGNISTALETLVSGAYIEVDPGPPGGRPKLEFEGLRRPPGMRSDEPGRAFVLTSPELRSLSVGAPVSFRGIAAGEVLSYDLTSPDGPFRIRVFVKAPYDGFVRPGSRFWAQSGVSLDTGPRGLHLSIAPLQALLSGGIAFDTPPADEATAPSEAEAAFPLYADEASAAAAAYADRVACVSYFRDSTAGLGRGSLVQILGFPIGSVTDTRVVPDEASPGRFRLRVAYEIQPDRLRGAHGPTYLSAERLRTLVGEGMRVALASDSFVTGQKALTLEYAPASRPSEVGAEDGALVLPSERGGGGDLAGAIGEASRTLGEVRELAQRLDAGLTPALKRIPEISDQLDRAAQRVNGALGEAGYGQDSTFQRDLERLMRQLSEAARAVRLLADFLDRHPESVLRGRTEGRR